MTGAVVTADKAAAVKTVVKAVERADNHPANRFSLFVFALSCIEVASNQIFGNGRKNG
jgi:hypothetical protein